MATVDRLSSALSSIPQKKGYKLTYIQPQTTNRMNAECSTAWKTSPVQEQWRLNRLRIKRDSVILHHKPEYRSHGDFHHLGLWTAQNWQMIWWPTLLGT